MASFKVDKNPIKAETLPFRVDLNFSRVFDIWEDRAASEDKTERAYAQSVLDTLSKVPELRETIVDFSLLDKYEEEIRLLFSPLFPESLQENEIKAVGIPFVSVFFNSTKRLQKILKNSEQSLAENFWMMDQDKMYVLICIFILTAHYKQNFHFKKPMLMLFRDKKTGVASHYRTFFNADFANIRPVGKEIKLTQEEILHLLDNFDDVDLWKKTFPPCSFVLEGFSLLSLFDVTEDITISELKSDLLNPQSLASKVHMDGIQDKLRSLFKIPTLRFGFCFIDEDKQEAKNMGYNHSSSLILSGEERLNLQDIMCQNSKKMLSNSGKGLILSNLDTADTWINPVLVEKLKEQGLKSYLGWPVFFKDVPVGVIELGSEKANDMNSVVAEKLLDIMPMFTTAVQRSRDEYRTNLEAFVQSKFTSIHPSVSWKFIQAAEEQLYGTRDNLEDIILDNVFPLYGQSDIKSSSEERNKAIAADLIEQMAEARKVITIIQNEQALPIFDNLKFCLDQATEMIKSGLNAGDEVQVLNMLDREVHPAFEHLKRVSAGAKKVIEDYESRLDPEVGMLYHKRKEYEDTVSLISDTLSNYLDMQQVLAQEMFPHYFEKYKTDGVEHSIYIGQSIVGNREYNDLYLRNLRLWQLLTIWGAEYQVKQIEPRMKIPLQIASLILVHSSSLGIRFRMDEKQFDVDGTYNVRYAIIKKRIDKALIRGTTERLTQPGKLAIVYTQEEDAREYKQYLAYMQRMGRIGPVIEDVELSEMQGVSGLRALRAELMLGDSEDINLEEELIETGVKSSK